MGEVPLCSRRRTPTVPRVVLGTEDNSTSGPYRGTSLIKTPPLPRATIWPWTKSYFWVPWGSCFV